MSHQLRLDESVTVERPLTESFAYIAEFGKIEEWDPAVKRGTRLTPGPVGVGTRFRIEMKAGFSLEYTIVEFEPNRRMLMDVKSVPFTAREEILFDSAEGGLTAIRYIADFNFRAPLSLYLRTNPAAMKRLGTATMRGMKRALEQKQPLPPPRRLNALADKLIIPGMLAFSKIGYECARRRWNPLSAHLGGKHVVITGITSGIGQACALQLARMGACITLVARDGERAERTRQSLIEETGNSNIQLQIADLSLLVETHALADRLLERGQPVDVLINNAGALFNTREETSEGYERSFALLLASPFVLTERLHPLLVAAGSARVINVSSGGMYTQRLRVNDLQSTRGTYNGAASYARAKRALVIAGEEWAQRWAADGISVNSMHPGWADTPGVRSSLPGFHRLTQRILRTPEQGADTISWLAAAPEVRDHTGLFWLDREPHTTHIRATTRESQEDRQALMQTLEKLLVAHGPTARTGAGAVLD